MKTVSRNKFLLCFRPVADMDLVIEAEGGIDRSTKNQALKYISESTYQTCSKGSDNSSTIVHEPPHRALSKAKGVRDRKSLTQESYQSKHIFSRKKSLDDKSSLLRNTCYDTDHHHLQDQTKSSRPVSSSQSSFGSTSPCTSTSSTILLESKRQDQNKKDQKEHAGSSSSTFNYAIGLLLLSLTVTILWGRVCAILFTSIWLYFLPQQQSGWRSEDEKELSRSESRDHYKKRIIIEQLLERSHRRGCVKYLT